MTRRSLPVLALDARPTNGAVATRISAFEQHLSSVLKHPTSEVRFDHHNRMLYATDASMYQVEPLGVVVPGSIDDSIAAVCACAEFGVAMLPRGGGTSLAGQCTNHAVVIDFSAHCTDVVSVDAERKRCTAHVGITLEQLNIQIAHTGLFFAPDPASARQCTVGGCIGNNAAGARSIKYGRTSENVLGVRVCLPDGMVVQFCKGEALRDDRVREITMRVVDVVQRHRELIRERFPTTLRRNAGYNLDLMLDQIERAGIGASIEHVLAEINLAQLVCGSEGTLCTVLEADLKLHRVSTARGLAVIGFMSIEDAITKLPEILKTQPSAVEMLDDFVIRAASQNIEYRGYVDLLPKINGEMPGAVLYVEYEASSHTSERSDCLASLRACIGDAPMHEYTDAEGMARAWKLRKAGEPLLHGLPGDRKPVSFVEDNAVPVERLTEFVHRFKQLCAKHDVQAAFWAHASVGVLHIRPMVNLRDIHDQQIMLDIAQQAAAIAKACDGVMSGEHGDGRVRGPLLEQHYGPELMHAFREIKRIFDPRNLLNPGNIVEPGPIESILQNTRINPHNDRNNPAVDVLKTETYFDYADQHGLLGAVEQCNGSGVCRKRTENTMCPSYRATLDERHSPRGRANALRLAVTGQLSSDPAIAWNDEEMKETLDLCLSCKACKSECPSNVDVAKMKSEYLAQSYRVRGRVPLSAKLFANVRTINRAGSIMPGLANAIVGWAPGRRVAQHLFGIDEDRSLPQFERPLSRSFRREDITTGDKLPSLSTKTVLLFGDCFSMYNETSIGTSAKRLLEAFGYRVILADVGCCSRPAVSSGLLEQAQQEARDTTHSLGQVVEHVMPEAVLFLEPSCHSAAIDDWLSLKLSVSREKREYLASRCMLVEQFLDMRWDTHPTRPQFTQSTCDVLLHGHCHQKALAGIDSSANMLRRVLGDRLRVLDTGCCGMAGAFGMTKEHAEISRNVAELSLLPAVRDAKAGDIICATGTSCRHQLFDLADVYAQHPVEVIASLLQ
ncbi:MAG: FAD-binding protein [Phycisphaeraceae bacterium]|nr:FAD-binding protein [Phycisphaerales bacterium]MCB9860366.1 FAD-binding protein [Phycisphaeraceae bacterium]